LTRRILIVEDDEKSRRLLTDVLAFHGYEVAATENGEEALRNALTRKPDLALLDIQLPGISGFEVLMGLRKAQRGEARYPVVAVTASVMEQDRRKILAAGFDAFVSKPVNIRELLDLLSTLFARDEA
jgi:two-component system, cell cycle response regulator DivK